MFKTIALLSVFAVSTELSAACQVGQENLKAHNSVSCSGDLRDAAAVFKFTSAKNVDMFISGEEHPGCGDFPSYQWQEVGAEGEILSSVDASQGMNAVAGKLYQLKVNIHEPSCSSYSLGLYVDSF